MTQRVVNYTYGTGNPVLPNGSTDVRDGIDNLQSMDVFMNAPEDTYNQRDGDVVKTVNGMNNEFNYMIQSQEIEFNQHIAGMSFTRVGTFLTGATLDDMREVLLCDVANGGDGHEYGWAGAFPKVVPPNSTPASTGGVGAGAWVDRSDVTLRSELAAYGGAGLVGGLAKPVTWVGFAGGADPTGVINADAAFASSAAYAGDVYIPAGKYKITAVYNGNFSIADDVEFVGGGEVMADANSLWPTSGNPSVVTRLNRLAVGDTAASLGAVKASTRLSWLGQKGYTAPNGTLQPNLGWIEQNARGTSYASEGSIGFAGAAHTAEMTGGAAIGLVGVGVNDNDNVAVNTWAMYADAKRYPNAGTTWGAEIAVVNHGQYISAEYAGSGKTFGMALVAGADPTINGVTEDCSLALAINTNGSKWGQGVVFNNSLRTFSSEVGVESYQKAIVLRNSNRIGWEDSSGATLNFINAKSTSFDQRTGIHFKNRMIDLEGAGMHMMRITHADGDNGYFRVFTASDANPVLRLGTEGAANCSVQLEAAGSGEVVVNRDIRPSTANTRKCGTSAFPWSGGATQTAFAVTSDARCKTFVTDISDVLLDIWGELKYKCYKLIDRVEEKGDAARLHLGLLTQDVDEAFSKHGLNARDYALFCYDEWEDQYERVHLNYGEMVTRTRVVEVPKTIEVEVEGKITSVPVGSHELRDTTEGEREVFVCEFIEVEEEYEDFADPIYEDRLIIPAGNRYSLRYEETYAIEAALQRRNYQRLLSRVEALEATN